MSMATHSHKQADVVVIGLGAAGVDRRDAAV